MTKWWYRFRCWIGAHDLPDEPDSTNTYRCRKCDWKGHDSW